MDVDVIGPGTGPFSHSACPAKANDQAARQQPLWLPGGAGPPLTIWHSSAPAAVRKAYQSGKEAEGWWQWAEHLDRRKRPVPLAELFPGKQTPLAWALPDGAAGQCSASELPDVLSRIEGLASGDGPGGPTLERIALGWLADAAGSRPNAQYAFEALAWSHALPKLAKRLPAELWWRLLGHLLDTASEAADLPLEADPVVHQLLSGELPLALAYLFPEIIPCRKLAPRARRSLSAGLLDLLDGEGLPHARHLAVLRPLLACWTRCRALGNCLAQGCWSKSAQVQFQYLIGHAFRLARHDGTQVFSNGHSGAWPEDLLQAAVDLAGNGQHAAIANVVLRGIKRSRRSGTARADRRRLPSPALHSEWAAVGILGGGWQPSAPRLAVAYPGQTVRIEFQCRCHVLWSGCWELEVRRDGQTLRPASAWEEVCWVSDNDVDYLELETQLSGGLRVQRHMLLAREDEFLLLADAILGDRPGELEYRGLLPLSCGVAFQPADESHEGFLVGRRRAALVLPLALPEWRADPRPGSLAQSGCGLELRQQAVGRSMFAPLFVDIRPRRMTRPLTWRQLTVAQDLAIQPSDVAVGYRVMIGKEQWLIYRSLASPANRTLLGHNLATEMLVARFSRPGEVQPLVEVE